MKLSPKYPVLRTSALSPDAGFNEVCSDLNSHVKIESGGGVSGRDLVPAEGTVTAHEERLGRFCEQDLTGNIRLWI